MDGEKVMVDWHGKRSVALVERLRAVKPEMRAMLTPLVTVDELAAAAAKLFGCSLLPEAESDDDMQVRLDMIDGILSQRDVKGRISYTASQVESCAIGLRKHAGTHPAIDAMLGRLADAKRDALGWRELSKRMTEGLRR